ncbi:MAG: CpaD family pilus assembly lipoprotein, partial [Pseudomonadota bacterium]
MTIIKTISLPILGAALTLGLGACQRPGTASPEVAGEHMPIVYQEVMTVDVRLAPDGSIPERELTRLDEWLDAVDVRYGDRVSLDSGDEPAFDRRQKQVAGLLSQRSLLMAEESPITSPAIASGTSRLVLVRAMASVPSCPDFGRRPNPEYQGSKSSNYNCATVSNLAAMVADPNDLVSGKTHSGVKAQVAVGAIAAQRERQTRDRVVSTVGSAGGPGAGGAGGGGG